MSILLALTGGFASGIFLRSLLVSGWSSVVFIALLVALVSGAAFLTPRRAYALGAMFLLALLSGYLRFAVADTPLPKAFAADLRHRVTYDGVVVGAPDARDTAVRTPVRVTKDGARTVVLVVSSRTLIPRVGERVRVSGTVHMPQPFSGDTGRVFRYDRYLEKDGIRYVLDYAQLSVTSAAPWYSVPALFARIHDAYRAGLDRALPEPYASLAAGLTEGGKSGLGTALKDAFARTGIVQIIVLSGYHVMLVAAGVLALLGRTALTRARTTVLAGLAITLFVLVAGAGAAAARALLMALLALFARATGKSYAAGRALFLTVLLLLLWNPFLLAFDPGFSLSVAATAGLIWLAPFFEVHLVFVRSAYLRGALALTLAAQLAVLPLLLYFIGTLSFVAIPANLLIMPVAPFTMIASALAGIFGAAFGSLVPLMASFVALPAYLGTAFLMFVAEKGAALPGAAPILPAFPFWLVLLAYAGLAYASTAAKRFSTTVQLRLSKNAST